MLSLYNNLTKGVIIKTPAAIQKNQVVTIPLEIHSHAYADIRQILQRSLKQINAKDVIGIDEAFANAHEYIRKLSNQ
jgi:hypothetical protein